MSKKPPLQTSSHYSTFGDQLPDFIPAYEPCLDGNEEEYVRDAVRSTWISYAGSYCDRLETDFAAFCGTDFALPTSSGTAALHLILAALDIGAGDEVIVPALTFVACANAVVYTGAKPVIADVDPITWNIRPDEVERLITAKTRAIMPVHLYGHPAPMNEIDAIVKAHDIIVVEDAAEAHGASINGCRTGALGRIAAFSLMGNKIVTAGEGGMVTSNDAALMDRCRLLRDNAMAHDRRYWHDEVGYNYRMTNLQAAVAVAQLERVDFFIERKREIARLYDFHLNAVPGVQGPVELAGCTNVYWMYSLLLDAEYPLTRDELMMELGQRNVDTRPFFHPLDTLPMYASAEPVPVAMDLSQRGISLPSSPKLTDEQVCYICEVIRAVSPN